MEKELRLATIVPVAVNENTWPAFSKLVYSWKGSVGDLILVLNNTSPLCRETVEKFIERDSDIKLLVYKKPFNLNACLNFGMQEAPGYSFYAFSNADVVFHKDWATNLLWHWKEQAGGEHQVLFAHTCHNEYGQSGPSFRKPGTLEHSLTESDAPLMQCFSIVAGTHEFDEQFDYWNTDCDFWFRCKTSGIKMMVANDVRVDHQEAVFTEGIRPQVNSVLASNKRMLDKWGDLYKGAV